MVVDRGGLSDKKVTGRDTVGNTQDGIDEGGETEDMSRRVRYRVTDTDVRSSRGRVLTLEEPQSPTKNRYTEETLKCVSYRVSFGVLSN